MENTNEDHVSMHCVDCYNSSSLVDVASFHTCTSCGEPAFTCVACAPRTAGGEHTSVTTICATCSVLEEVASGEEASLPPEAA
jgi:hypothetical protein